MLCLAKCSSLLLLNNNTTPLEGTLKSKRNMDPASVVGVIGVVGQVISAIYAYGDAVLDYKSEVARLRSELFGMQPALTQIEQDLTLASKCGTLALKSPNLGPTHFQRTLHETHAILAQLVNALDDGITNFHRNAKRLV
jgi:hypothetical protein